MRERTAPSCAALPPEYPPGLRRLATDMMAQIQAIGRVERTGLITRGWTPHQLNLWFASAVFLLRRHTPAPSLISEADHA